MMPGSKRPRSRCGRWSAAAALLPLSPTVAVEARWSTSVGLHSAWMGRGGSSNGDDETAQQLAVSSYNQDPSGQADRTPPGNQGVNPMDQDRGDGELVDESTENSPKSPSLHAKESALLGDFEQEIHSSSSLDYRSELQETFHRWKRKMAQSKAKLKTQGVVATQADPTKPVKDREDEALTGKLLGRHASENEVMKQDISSESNSANATRAANASPSNASKHLDENTERIRTATQRRERVEFELAEKRQLLMDLLSSYQQQEDRTISPKRPPSSHAAAWTHQTPQSSPSGERLDAKAKSSAFGLQSHATSRKTTSAQRRIVPQARKSRDRGISSSNPYIQRSDNRNTAAAIRVLDRTTPPVAGFDEPEATLVVRTPVTKKQIGKRRRKRKNVLVMASTSNVNSIDRRIWNAELKGGETSPHVALLLPPASLLSADDIQALRPHVRMLAIALLYILATSIALRLMTWALGIRL